MKKHIFVTLLAILTSFSSIAESKSATLELQSQLPKEDGVYNVIFLLKSDDDENKFIAEIAKKDNFKGEFWQVEVLFVKDGKSKFSGCRKQTADCSTISVETAAKIYSGYTAIVRKVKEITNINLAISFFNQYYNGKKYDLLGYAGKIPTAFAADLARKHKIKVKSSPLMATLVKYDSNAQFLSIKPGQKVVFPDGLSKVGMYAGTLSFPVEKSTSFFKFSIFWC